MFCEVTIVMKDAERTYRHKFPIYEPFQMDDNDPVLKTCIETTMKEFGATPDDVTVKTSMSL